MAVWLVDLAIAREQISTFIDQGWIKGLYSGIFQYWVERRPEYVTVWPLESAECKLKICALLCGDKNL